MITKDKIDNYMKKDGFSIKGKISRIRDAHGKPLIIAIAMAIVLILAVTMVSKAIIEQQRFHYETIFDVSTFINDLDTSWHTSSENPVLSEARVEANRGFPENCLVIYFYRPGTNVITLTKGETMFSFEIAIDENKKVSIRPL